MLLPLFIAKRYLISKKKQNAINIISFISIAGICIGTAALISIFSVFNGIELLLEKNTDSFTPDIVISPQKGNSFKMEDKDLRELKNLPFVSSVNKVVEINAMAKFEDVLMPVLVKGVEPEWHTANSLEEHIVRGEYKLGGNGSPYGIAGYAIAMSLGIRHPEDSLLSVYYPERRESLVNGGIKSSNISLAGIFSVQQDVDSKYLITDISFARDLAEYKDEYSQVELRLTTDKIEKVKSLLCEKWGNSYKIDGKYDLNPAFYAMMRSEKLSVFLILVFILIIASFNIIGSISMLILDKKEDIHTYRAMGMSRHQLVSVFKTEGNIITFTGALSGGIIGILICRLQEVYGFIKLGQGSFMFQAYPVALKTTDVAIVLLTVIAIGYTVSLFPVRILVRKITSR